MNDTVQIGRWVLRPDVGRTLAAHSQLTQSGAAECSCAGCANFEAVRPQVLRGPLGRILDQLGISPPWEVQVYEMGRGPSGLHHYGGWFHFVGTIESGSAAWRPVSDRSDVRTAAFELNPSQLGDEALIQEKVAEQLMSEFGGLSKRAANVEDYYTNDFLPKM